MATIIYSWANRGKQVAVGGALVVFDAQGFLNLTKIGKEHLSGLLESRADCSAVREHVVNAAKKDELHQVTETEVPLTVMEHMRDNVVMERGSRTSSTVASAVEGTHSLPSLAEKVEPEQDADVAVEASVGSEIAPDEKIESSASLVQEVDLREYIIASAQELGMGSEPTGLASESSDGDDPEAQTDAISSEEEISNVDSTENESDEESNEEVGEESPSELASPEKDIAPTDASVDAPVKKTRGRKVFSPKKKD